MVAVPPVPPVPSILIRVGFLSPSWFGEGGAGWGFPREVFRFLYMSCSRKNGGTAGHLTEFVSVQHFKLSYLTFSKTARPVFESGRAITGRSMGTISELRRRSSLATRPAPQPSSGPVAASRPIPVSPPDGARPWYEPTAAVLKASAAGSIPAASPCPSCRCPLFWLDSYGRVRCAECSPPASESMQRGDLHVVLIDDAPAWLHDHLWLTVPDSPDKDRSPVKARSAESLARDEMRPTLEQIDSGECVDNSDPCPQCGKKFLEINFLAEKFCRNCKSRSSKTSGRKSSVEHLPFLARVAWHTAEMSPGTAKRREEIAARRTAPPDAPI